MMSSTRLILLGIVTATSCVAVAQPPLTTVRAQQRTVSDFFTAFSDEWVRTDPNLAVRTRYFSGDEQGRLEREVTPANQAFATARIDRARRGLEELGRFDRNAMSDTERLAADTLAFQLQLLVDLVPFRDYAFPFNQMSGTNINLIDAFTNHPVQSKADADNYLARLGQLPLRLDEALAEARRMAGNGLLPPRFILQATIDQMRLFEQMAPRLNPLVTTLMTKLESTAVPVSDRQVIEQRVSSMVEGDVYPAWRRIIADLERLLPRASDDAGLWRYSNGLEAYALQLRANTTTQLTADQIHQIGLQQVARIEAEMEQILTTMGRTSGSLKERIAQLEKEQAYPMTEDGRAQILRDLTTTLRDAETRARNMFDIAPKAPVTVEAFPRFREANAAANYTPPSPDGARPGVFRIPLRASYMTRFGTRSLVYHETVPGHHFQVAINLENLAQPRFLQMRLIAGLPAASEGWGLYAERLAIENGWYDGDPIGRLGALDSELFRARRLVVDTGLHAKRWTRQQAIDYGIEASEIDRYVVQPGQACAYMIGQLKYIELRQRAQAALGSRFSLKEFHGAVLRLGILPLDVLDREIDRYIKTR